VCELLVSLHVIAVAISSEIVAPRAYSFHQHQNERDGSGQNRAVAKRLYFKGSDRKDPRFVLAAIGHVAGVINPPARNKRSHWLNDNLNCEAKDWLEGAEEKLGSWWPD
jgi:poly(3-hydroxyalkanoate) synthetase